MSFDHLLCAGAGLIVVIYLVAAMLRPEKF